MEDKLPIATSLVFEIGGAAALRLERDDLLAEAADGAERGVQGRDVRHDAVLRRLPLRRVCLGELVYSGGETLCLADHVRLLRRIRRIGLQRRERVLQAPEQAWEI
jgi:hypothetical protein